MLDNSIFDCNMVLLVESDKAQDAASGAVYLFGNVAENMKGSKREPNGIVVSRDRTDLLVAANNQMQGQVFGTAKNHGKNREGQAFLVSRMVAISAFCDIKLVFAS